MHEIVIFAAISLVLTYVSRASLFRPGTHGFYRFFAWELMAALFVMNLGMWYVDVEAPHQVISGVLFFISLMLVLSGYALLHISGKPDSSRNDVPMIGFEKTTTLVTTGIYRYVRHPIYASLFFLCWGFFFKQPSWLGAALATGANGLLIVTARVEEQENINYFGDEYREYMKRSKMFVPFIL